MRDSSRGPSTSSAGTTHRRHGRVKGLWAITLCLGIISGCGQKGGNYTTPSLPTEPTTTTSSSARTARTT